MKFTDLFVKRPSGHGGQPGHLIAGLQSIRLAQRPAIPAQRHRGRHRDHRPTWAPTPIWSGVHHDAPGAR